METNCSSLVSSVCGGGADGAMWAATVSEIIGISRLLPECIFQHVGREANRVVHQLAKKAQEEKEWTVMRQDFPPDV
jgi:hypothetical protein